MVILIRKSLSKISTKPKLSAKKKKKEPLTLSEEMKWEEGKKPVNIAKEIERFAPSIYNIQQLADKIRERF